MTKKHYRMKRMDNWQSWMVLDITTGAVDGFYAARSDAEGVRDHLQDEYPGGAWLVLSMDTRRNPNAFIPDAMFWRNRLNTTTAR